MELNYCSLQINIKVPNNSQVTLDVKVTTSLKYIVGSNMITDPIGTPIYLESLPNNSKLSYLGNLPIVERVIGYDITPIDDIKLEGSYILYYPAEEGHITLRDTNLLISRILESALKVPSNILNVPLALNNIFIRDFNIFK